MKLQGLKVFLTGARGRLGVELSKRLLEKGAVTIAPNSLEWDITKGVKPSPLIVDPLEVDLVIHAAAYTDVPGAEENRFDCVKTNIYGTETVANFAKSCRAKAVYISSDYVTAPPLSFYAFTKLAGEAFFDKQKDMIIRTSFKSRGMWGEKALKKVFHPVYTNGDWVDIIAELIVKAIEENRTGVVNLGTKVKTLKDLALEEYPLVQETPVTEADTLLGYYYPRDTTMDLTI
jgi:dTDP-4-dehydrorhamnose reductase